MKRLPATIVVALLALGLTATAVFAATTPQHPSGPKSAAAAVHTAPPVAGASLADASKSPDADETAEASESADPADTAGADAAPSAHPSNHGGIVSAAAQASTPAGCQNHGQYVSLVARGLYNAAAPCATPAPDAAGAPAVSGRDHANPKAKGHNK